MIKSVLELPRSKEVDHPIGTKGLILEFLSLHRYVKRGIIYDCSMGLFGNRLFSFDRNFRASLQLRLLFPLYVECVQHLLYSCKIQSQHSTPRNSNSSTLPKLQALQSKIGPKPTASWHAQQLALPGYNNTICHALPSRNLTQLHAFGACDVLDKGQKWVLVECFPCIPMHWSRDVQ